MFKVCHFNGLRMKVNSVQRKKLNGFVPWQIVVTDLTPVVFSGWWHENNSGTFALRMNFLTFIFSCVTLAEVIHMEHIRRGLPATTELDAGLVTQDMEREHSQQSRDESGLFARPREIAHSHLFGLPIRASAKVSFTFFGFKQWSPQPCRWHFWFVWCGPFWPILDLNGSAHMCPTFASWRGGNGRKPESRDARTGDQDALEKTMAFMGKIIYKLVDFQVLLVLPESTLNFQWQTSLTTLEGVH